MVWLRHLAEDLAALENVVYVGAKFLNRRCTDKLAEIKKWNLYFTWNGGTRSTTDNIAIPFKC